MTQAQWLWLMVGLQLALFGAGWLGAVRFGTVANGPLRGLALFNLSVGVGLGLIGLRGLLPYVVTHTVANLLNVLAFLLLWRAGQQLLGHPVMAREQAGLAALSGVLIVVFGLSPETAQQRVAIVLFAIAWISCRASTLAYDRLRREQIPGAAIALILTGWIVGLLLIARGVSGLVSDTPIEFSHDAPVTLALAYVLLVAIFAVNLVFAYVLLQRTVRALTRLSRVDPLTGLFNRRAIVEALQREWQRHGPDGAGFSVVCIDVDHFKAINDGHGHAVGDAVLVGLAQRMSSGLQIGETLGRSGGEEFLLLLPGAGPEAARARAEGMRAGLADGGAMDPSGICHVTVSMGVASARATDPSIDAILARADAALYRAKADGRDCIRTDGDRAIVQTRSGLRAAVRPVHRPDESAATDAVNRPIHG